MKVRVAENADFITIQEIISLSPELRVSSSDPILTKEEFLLRLHDPDYLLLVAEEQTVCGFLLATMSDKDRPLQQRYACIVYLAVHPQFQHRGFGTQLLRSCEGLLQQKGITHLYTWASTEHPGIAALLSRAGFQSGKTYRWMEKKL